MERSTFKSVLGLAKSLEKAHAENKDYRRSEFCRGFRRGIRRLFHGENFGTDEEHNKWMNCADGEYRKQLQAGYRTGFNYHGQKLEV